MIDTIVLTIYKPNYQIDPSINLKRSFQRGMCKRIYNPTKAQIDKYGYLPRVTEIEAARKGGYATFLQIEFSCPNILFGNNFDEVDEDDSRILRQITASKLIKMGITLNGDDVIKKAEVSRIHYSKNIVLDDYTFPYNYISEIAKINVNKHLDVNKTDYRNDGLSIKIRSKDFEIIFYDKLADLRKSRISESSSIEQDNYFQLALLDNIPKNAFQVLRMEVRINSRKKLRSFLNKYNIKVESLNFESLFSESISKRILQNIFTDIEAKYPNAILAGSDNESKLASIIQRNHNLKPGKILELLMAIELIDKKGVRGFRNCFENYGKHFWYRLNKELKSLKIGDKPEYFKILENKLMKFEKIELEKYKDKL
jgi:hypothetical protein